MKTNRFQQGNKKTEAVKYCLSCNRPVNKVTEEYYSIVRDGKDNQRSEKFKGILTLTSEAGKAFVKAAEFANSKKMHFITVIARYEKAAECFLRAKDSQAFTNYVKAIDLYFKNGKIEKAIECCFRWGNNCAQELGDSNKAEELYKKGEEMRGEHKSSHSCVITNFEEKDYGQDCDKALDTKEKLCAGIVLVRMINCPSMFLNEGHSELVHVKVLQRIQTSIKKENNFH
ncbi:hypothetical protein RF11_15184 [Thelohanellus kitauei]|uniref:Alpha-soluble NSF attachment protein n=1 Tax=Thelohanellus kitauei TaxID=669202 RepID=A0A0C2N8N8_THEKT|nr:hypothetical protein RF11_15184 [Thelohanellus kitauei]